jgi:hypothetical protein
MRIGAFSGRYSIGEAGKVLVPWPAASAWSYFAKSMPSDRQQKARAVAGSFLPHPPGAHDRAGAASLSGFIRSGSAIAHPVARVSMLLVPFPAVGCHFDGRATPDLAECAPQPGGALSQLF